jgi:hypothetical protein
MCGCVYVWVFRQLCGCFGNMCTCIYCVFVVLFMYIYSYLLLVKGLLPPSENSIAVNDDDVNNNNNNNNNNYYYYYIVSQQLVLQ